jgi:hypothetical protein
MNNDDQYDELAHEWDELLRGGLIQPPENFRANVMHRLQHEAYDANASKSQANSLAELLQAVVVAVGAVAAAWQTLTFIFGLWVTTVAI